MVCQILLQDVVVESRATFLLAQYRVILEEINLFQQTSKPSKYQSPDIVTLLVSPQDFITLSYMMQTNAVLNMTLRNPSDDQARQATEAKTFNFF